MWRYEWEICCDITRQELWHYAWEKLWHYALVVTLPVRWSTHNITWSTRNVPIVMVVTLRVVVTLLVVTCPRLHIFKSKNEKAPYRGRGHTPPPSPSPRSVATLPRAWSLRSLAKIAPPKCFGSLRHCSVPSPPPPQCVDPRYATEDRACFFVYFTEHLGFRFLTRVPMGNYLPVWAKYQTNLVKSVCVVVRARVHRFVTL